MKKFIICAFFLSISLFSSAFALDLRNIKTAFLKKDYKAAIQEGEKLIATAQGPQGLEELYYILGVSYLKEENYLRASDIFEIIIKEYNDSAFYEEASLGLGDTFFLRGKITQAKETYERLLISLKKKSLEPLIYERLIQCYLRLEDKKSADDLLNLLKQRFPDYLSMLDTSGSILTEIDFYTIQVGAFTKKINAERLLKKLTDQGYPAYIPDSSLGQTFIYRVRVGRYRTLYEAQEVAKKLLSEGYPARIIP